MSGPDPSGGDPAQRLRGRSGRDFWRSLDELADTPEFRRWLEAEFPAALDLAEGVDRRRFLKVMGASFALAGLSGCVAQGPPEDILPYVKDPERIVPGRPVHYATAVSRAGFGLGVVATSHMGRPTKLEGNPDHPSSLGATDTYSQAAVLTLYDPDRTRAVHGPDGVNTFGTVRSALEARLEALAPRGGRGLAIVSGPVTSPTRLAQIGRVLTRLPEARWYAYDPLDAGHAAAGARQALGRAVHPVYRLAEADVVLSLDEDLLHTPAGRVRYAHDLAARRRARAGSLTPASMSRLLAVEPTPSLFGAYADHVLPLRHDHVPPFAFALARALGLDVPEPPAGRLGEEAERWLEVVPRELLAHPGRALVVAGERQPPEVHALALAMTAWLDGVGRTVRLLPPLANGELEPEPVEALAQTLRRDQVDTLLALDCNPAYDTAAELGLGDLITAAPLSVHLGLYRDETAHRCRWHVPLAHELERWGDVRGHDGTTTVLQPLIRPLYRGRTEHDLLAILEGRPLVTEREAVRSHWRERGLGDEAWRSALRLGVIPGSAPAPLDLEPRELGLAPPPESPAGGLELVLGPDPTVWDGRFADNAWLQELPKPLTMFTWSNAALIAPTTARALGIENGRLVELEVEGRTVTVPAWLMPGQAEEVVALSFGYGRLAGGRVGVGLGADAYRLRTRAEPFANPRVALRRLERVEEPPATQNHHLMEGRELYRDGTVEEFALHPAEIAGKAHQPPHHSLYPEYAYEGQQWGMVIDLSTCIGCGACTVACQAENNIPVVGPEQVAKGREMHWIRVDRYFSGPEHRPRIHHQPVPCMHCEKAPCELVCPVGATQHSSDGLNEMLYNRCIGTRYCSNNCPYKVRRFNFFRFTDADATSLALQRNPNVTVRGRGVMEKCTYCVQRIRRAGIDARVAGLERIPEAALETACQQVCPTRAILFGDVLDPGTQVARAKLEPHEYGLLEELNTQPRTSYLAAVRHPLPELEEDR